MTTDPKIEAIALSFYQAPELVQRAKTSIANLRLKRGRSGVLADEA